MERISRFRASMLLLLFVLVLIFYVYTMYDLQVIETGGVIDNTTTFTTLTRVKAARGDILDRNGNKLVGNRASYDLVINHYVLQSANGTNNHIINLLRTCQERGIQHTDHFPVSAEKPFVYTLDEYNSTWKNYFQAFLDYQGGLDSDITAPLLVEKLREVYRLPEDMSDEEARRVIGLRYELSLRNCVPSLSTYVFLEDAKDSEISAIVELNVPGLTIEATTVREYYTNYAAHILGHVAAINAEQWESTYKEKSGYEMDSLIGQSGLEAAYEEYLHGTDGWRQDTVAVDGTLISSVYLTEPKAGANVEVSIDTTLQMVAETQLASVIADLRALEETVAGHDVEGGAVVVMDVKTSQVLVSASYPTYTLADYSTKFDELLEEDYSPLTNRALMSTYPPGSIYKMVTTIAAIENGIIGLDTMIETKGLYTKYSDLQLRCAVWSEYGPAAHGTIDIYQALTVSCNYFFYVVGDMIDIWLVDEVAKQLGLGEPTGVELPENTGYRANPETKARLHDGEAWSAGDNLTTVIGQNENSFTPLQMCVYATALANKGVRNKATFMNRVVSSDYQELLLETSLKQVVDMELQPYTIEAYFSGMQGCVYRGDGTAKSEQWVNVPATVAGKTGTADQYYGASANGSFVCFAPVEDPQVAIAIYVEKGAHGSTLASIARAILREYFNAGTVSEADVYENRLC